VLRDARIRFTQPNCLNDPFELKPFFKTALNIQSLPYRIRERMDLRPALLKKYETMPVDLRNRVSAEQFVQFGLVESERRKLEFDAIFESELAAFIDMQPELGEAFRTAIHQHFGAEIGILSLSEDPINDLMWAHYAKDHSGFVLEFDESNEFFSRKRSDGDEFYHLRKVQYIDRPLNAESLEELVDSDLFASKLSKWSYEQEWRILVPLTGRQAEIQEGENQIHLIAIPKAAIQGVIFGMRLNDDTRQTIFKILEMDATYNHVRLREEFLDLERGRLSIRDLPRS